MKIFIRSGDVTADNIMVMASYSDNTDIADDAHGSGYSVMYVPDNAIERRQLPGQPEAMYLKSNWRESADAIMNGESTRRIAEIFPDDSQRAALAETNSNMMAYGLNIADWPADARTRKGMFDAGWNYITSVKQTAEALKSAVPANPSDDSHWPNKPAKIVV